MELLLKEAQQEIALLRTDLFNTRRLAEERRQAVDALQSERERLAKHCEEVEGQLRAANAQLNHVPELQQRCAHLEGQLRKLQSEIETAHAARRILEQELDDERRQRGAMTEQKSLLEGDRARLAKQRDDLAAQLRVEQKKAREAEEEQVRAEEDAAALRAELAALQQSNAAAAASSSSVAAALPTATAAAAAAAAGPASTADTAATIAASVAAATGPLLEQVEHERNRAAMLLSNLHAAKSEIMELSNKIADYEARHVQSISHGPQDNEHLVQQLAMAQRRSDELAERLMEATERGRRLEEEAQALREAAQAAAEAAAKAVDEAAAATAAATAAHGGGLHAGLPPLPPGGSNSHHHQQSEASAAGGAAQHQVTAALRQSAATEAMHHRVASSGSLYGSGHNELLMQEGTELSADDVSRLRQQVTRLKASRDKLLLEIDKQWEEIERLSGENAALADDLRAARALATNWEKQAQDGIAQVEQLKDLLEDSARWEAATLAEHQQHHQGQLTVPGSSPIAGAVVTTAPAPQTLERLRVELLGEKARATELELQLRAVAAELLRCQHGSLDLGKSFLPMMAGVEKRLAELCRKAHAAT
ncbi:hypothetical protein HXX76_014403 [Chlamydomonas incerta]|uniref:Uncharacterized protein n=1 Tax=Chlamydomonas incerta TaxID=51695 RepID=A0A835SC13_CHLIN|nr:hypothetical protein HXX76_014403 [Chlamydomonas incerta]|eukprot:KAG2424522.1 hypothetical protein HXX76_014403 [Chlamydomonas incerta]